MENESVIVNNIMDADPKQEYVLEILRFSPSKGTTKKKSNQKFNNEEDLRKCLDILISHCYSIEDIKNGRNIYCPIHENAKTSKTPSAKLNIESGYLTCFSSNCTIPVNCKTGYRQLPATQLLAKLQKR